MWTRFKLPRAGSKLGGATFPPKIVFDGTNLPMVVATADDHKVWYDFATDQASSAVLSLRLIDEI
jgi:hypothetical protein